MMPDLVRVAFGLSPDSDASETGLSIGRRRCRGGAAPRVTGGTTDVGHAHASHARSPSKTAPLVATNGEVHDASRH